MWWAGRGEMSNERSGLERQVWKSGQGGLEKYKGKVGIQVSQESR